MLNVKIKDETIVFQHQNCLILKSVVEKTTNKQNQTNQTPKKHHTQQK